MDTGNGNGWKGRSLGRAFLDGFDGIRDASRERIMRRIWGCLAAIAFAGIIREFKPLGWILLVASAGVFISREHDNNVHERQEARWNRAMVKLGLQPQDYNDDTRYILHQATASVLTIGISGLVAGILVLIFNP